MNNALESSHTHKIIVHATIIALYASFQLPPPPPTRTKKLNNNLITLLIQNPYCVCPCGQHDATYTHTHTRTHTHTHVRTHTYTHTYTHTHHTCTHTHMYTHTDKHTHVATIYIYNTVHARNSICTVITLRALCTHNTYKSFLALCIHMTI